MSGGGEPLTEDRLLDGLSDDELRLRPGPSLNSNAWLFWHMARSEDLAVNVLIAGRPQVLEENGWLQRLNLPQRDMGTGMSDEEVIAVSAQLDIASLRSYRVAVGRRTQEVLQSLPVDVLDEPIDPARLLAVGAFSDTAEGERRVASYWRDRPKRFVFASSLATHSYLHLGEAGCLTSLVMRIAHEATEGGIQLHAACSLRRGESRRQPADEWLIGDP